MLNSNEHEIYPAQKCYNAKNCWHLTFISMINTASESLKARTIFNFQLFSFYELFIRVESKKCLITLSGKSVQKCESVPWCITLLNPLVNRNP